MQKRISLIVLCALLFAAAVAWQWQSSTGQAVAEGHEILAMCAMGRPGISGGRIV